MWRGQLNQDEAVINFYKGLRNGYFVDVGAYDGEELSNTFVLEKRYDWKGICIEPQPKQFETLQKKRSCICLQTAVSDRSGERVSFVEAGLFGGIENSIDKHTFVLDPTNNRIQVETVTLTELLDKHKAPPFIHYLTIDTEGTEEKILQGIDFSRYTFGYITIEHNYMEERRRRMRQLLEDHGYRFFRQNKWDDDFAHPNALAFCQRENSDKVGTTDSVGVVDNRGS